MRTMLFAAAFALATPMAALAQADHSAHGEAQGGSTVVDSFEAVNAKMHEDMAVELTGDADVDFVRSMIPHHQGAIDMARVVLEHGEDPDIRALAEEVISAQEAEIAEMREWLAENGHAE